jgi:excisionase family DNA binding protein
MFAPSPAPETRAELAARGRWLLSTAARTFAALPPDVDPRGYVIRLDRVDQDLHALEREASRLRNGQAPRSESPARLPVPVTVDLARIYKPAEAAALLGVDRRTVKRWAAEGRLRATSTAGGHVRVLGADLAAALANIKSTAPANDAAGATSAA